MEVKDIFTETRKVITDYHKRENELDKQEQEVKSELEALQIEMTAVILDQEGASLSERIYLKAQAKEINTKADIINTMLEELEEKRTTLKFEFAPLYQTSLKKDRGLQSEYNALKIAEKYRYLMLSEIAEIGEAMQKQYHEIEADICKVYRDTALTEKFPHLRHAFSPESYKPFFSWFNKSVVSKDEVFSATVGVLPEDVKRQQKDVQ